jgi:hypothetical protein
MAEFVGCTLSAEKLPRVRVIYGNYSRLKPFIQYVKPSSKFNAPSLHCLSIPPSLSFFRAASVTFPSIPPFDNQAPNIKDVLHPRRRFSL